MNAKKIYGWFCVFLGTLAILGSLSSSEDFYSLLGGALFFLSGWIMIDSQEQIESLKNDVMNLNDENFDLEEALDDATR